MISRRPFYSSAWRNAGLLSPAADGWFRTAEALRIDGGFAVVVLILASALLLGCVRGIAAGKAVSPRYSGLGVFMPGIARLLLALACGGSIGLMSDPARAAVPEWNPVRSHGAQLGPEASRLVVGFRATESNSTVQAIRSRMRAQSIKIVQANTSDADVAGLAQRTGLAMARSRQMTPSMHVVFLQKTLYGADVKAALERLRSDPAVEFAEVDQRRYAHSAPDDPLFVPSSGASGQWFMQPPTPSATTITVNGTQTQDLSATDAVSAWAITTGSTGTVIADIDTGVRFDHADLQRAGFGGRLLPGYDFVGEDLNPTTGAALGTFLIANDGDGWDPDPSDPGDWISSTDQQNTTLFPAAKCDFQY